MFWLRRLTVYVASIVLLFTLVAVAYLVSVLFAVHSSSHIKLALQSKQAYDGFISFNTERATKLVSQDVGGAIGADKLTPIVRKAVLAAYPKDFYDSSSSQIIDANYNWLTSKTAKPDFAINLSPSKDRFDRELNTSVGGLLGDLKNCSFDQLRQIGSLEISNLIKYACKPAGLSGSALSSQFSQQLIGRTPLLANPVITPDNPNPFVVAGATTEPYYKKLSSLPSAYKTAKQFPIYIGIIAALALLFIVAVDTPRRHGWRVLARTFIIAGALLLAGKIITAIVFNKAVVTSLQHNGGGQYTDSFSSIYHSVTDVMTRQLFVFGLAYIAVGLVIIVALLLHKAVQKRRTNDTNKSVTGGKLAPQTTSYSQPGANPMPKLVPRKQKPEGLNRRGIIQ